MHHRSSHSFHEWMQHVRFSWTVIMTKCTGVKSTWLLEGARTLFKVRLARACHREDTILRKMLPPPTCWFDGFVDQRMLWAPRPPRTRPFSRQRAPPGFEVECAMLVTSPASSSAQQRAADTK